MSDARDIYRAIMVAAARGRGLRLSWDEVFDLSLDDAISQRAANSLSAAEVAQCDPYLHNIDWARFGPYLRGEPANATFKD